MIETILTVLMFAAPSTAGPQPNPAIYNEALQKLGECVDAVNTGNQQEAAERVRFTRSVCLLEINRLKSALDDRIRWESRQQMDQEPDLPFQQRADRLNKATTDARAMLDQQLDAAIAAANAPKPKAPARGN